MFRYTTYVLGQTLLWSFPCIRRSLLCQASYIKNAIFATVNEAPNLVHERGAAYDTFEEGLSLHRWFATHLPNPSTMHEPQWNC